MDFLANMNKGDIVVALGALAAFISVVVVALPFLTKDHKSSRLKQISKAREELSRKQMDDLAKPKGRSLGNRGKKEGAAQIIMKAILTRLKLDDVLSSKKIKAKLAQAGYRSPSAITTYMLSRFASAIAFAAITAFFVFVSWKGFPYPPIMKFVFVGGGMFAGFFLPTMLVSNKAQKRQFEMGRNFPDAMDLLVICVESGLSVEGAFDRVTEELSETAPALAQEFGLTTAELAYLGDRHKAYENFASRTGMPAVKSLATTLQQSEKYGTPVGVALKVLSQEKREERMSAAEQKGAALPAKLTVPMIVFFLPLLFAVVIGPAVIQIVRMD